MSALQRAVVRVGLVLLLSSMGIVQSGSVPQVMAAVSPTIMPDPGPPGATQLGELPEFGDVQAGAVISKTAPAEIMAGTLLTYTIVASDGGLGAVVTDAVPYDTWYVAGSMVYSPVGLTVSMTEPNPPSAGSVMTWVVEYLTEPISLTFAVTAAVTTDETVVENTAWLEGTTATAATLIRGLPELKLTKTVGPSDLIGPGEPITYTVTFSNEGSDVAAGVLVTDAVPNELTGVHATGSGAAITATGVISYSWQVEDLMPDQGGIITITGLVKTGLAGGLLVTNTAEIAAATQESDATDNTESVVVTVINVAPVAYDLSFSTAEDTPLNGTFSGEDANGDGLVYGIEDPPVEGTVDVTDSIAGAFVYTPTLNFNGLITFTYQATDGLAFSNQAAVTVTVSPANDPPLLDLNGPDPGTGFGAIFRQGQGPVPVASPSLTVQDPDDEVLVGAIITIANRLNGTAEMLAAQAAGAVTVTDNPATGVLTLTGPAPRAGFQQVLSTVTYVNTAFPLRLEARGLIFSISDGTNVSFATATVAIVERPPVYLPLVARHGLPDCSPDQYEPNDSPAQAYQLTANTTLRANFCEEGDRDEYKLTLSSTTNPLDITLSNIPQGCDYDLYLFRVPNSGDPIQVAKSKQNGNLNEHISYVPSQAADYLLLVYAYLKGTQARGSFYQLDIILQ